MVMDEFAQTRGADDLFDDDFTPIVEPEQQTYQRAAQSSQHPDPQPPQQEHSYDQVPRGPRNASTRVIVQPPRRPSQAPPPPTQSTSISTTTTKTKTTKTTAPPPAPAPVTTTTTTATPDDPTAPAPAPAPTPSTEPSTPRAPRTAAAVRGDRLATGGTPKPKLTEEELSAKLAAAKINNEKRTEAHRLAEADEASFQQREAKATERRKEEGKARRLMDLEREKNRLRKLEAAAMGGREWDEGKKEEEEELQSRGGVNGGVRGRGGRYVGGGGGGALVGEDADEMDSGRGGRGGGYGGRGFQGRGRGRGDRGGDRGRGGGRGRGGPYGGTTTTTTAIVEQKAPDPATDFPALPTGQKPSKGGILPSNKPDESLKSPISNGASWADQVNETET